MEKESVNGVGEVLTPRSTGSAPLSQSALSGWQYWTVTATVTILTLLLVTQVILSQLVQYDGHQLAVVEETIQQGQQAYVGLQRLASRTYQLSQSDAGLKDVVIRQRITLKPPTGTGSDSTTSSGDSSSTANASSSSNPSPSAARGADNLNKGHGNE